MSELVPSFLYLCTLTAHCMTLFVFVLSSNEEFFTCTRKGERVRERKRERGREVKYCVVQTHSAVFGGEEELFIVLSVACLVDLWVIVSQSGWWRGREREEGRKGRRERGGEKKRGKERDRRKKE